MTGDRFARLVEVFDRARQLPESQRDDFLSEACRGDAELLADVRDILEHLPDDDFLEPRENSTAAAEPQPDRPSRIGAYRLIEVLGEGGMGTVYLAEQDEPVSRRVAVKVIKLGMDSASVLARFELERQSLAAMSHRTIAKVFDAGATNRGQPYFVMELVEGLPLTQYCDDYRLPLKDRIALFRQVCAGVHHAHQKGVIHRDLKPGNILVVHEGDSPVPKILDFGLAKATNRALLAETMDTEHEQILGTPEYMSPEQACLNHEVVDTRSDIYSLGVILFELLSGELPFAPEQLRQGGWGGVQQTLTETQPPRPSSRLAGAGEAAATSARHRRTTAPRLARELRGDLDWIVLKALAKEPERRYESAAELAMDLGRQLAHEPVLAGPPTAGYRLKKLVRRHRGQVIAGAIVLLTLIAGIAGVGYENARALRRTREFDMLALVVHLEAARGSESTFDPAWPNKVVPMRAWLQNDVRRLRDGAGKVQETLAALRSRATRNADGEYGFDSDADRFLHDTLARVLRDVASFEENEVRNVRQRLLWAENVEELTIRRYQRQWEEARAAIRSANGTTASTLYRAHPIDLPPQLGLIPIGMNPVTKLWEFYHLRSAWNPRTDQHPAELPIPSHDAGGNFPINGRTGIVFILVPGGVATIGAQATDANGIHYDPWAQPMEGPPHEVELAPFFLARHETTQGQWPRLADGENPAHYGLPWFKLFETALQPGPYTRAHPVEEVDWWACKETLRKHGLVLPTEAQWEYACRAGTSFPWWTGPTRDTLLEPGPAENLAARSAERGTAPWTAVVSSELDDGYALSAPIGALRPNPWGFMHMHGNVSEWCRDRIGSYADPVAPGDGERMVESPEVRVFRGGGFDYAAPYARCASRTFLTPHANSVSLGVRPARAVQP